ncbi:efflux RND transporter permease subunit [Aciduricibacillus chroicocephali]|uniref:Efflux RND transporter permease subunit n=1 Tax=Aciduricibacillus chroicocephali TaxID=3054939 RepID=A0ABY9KWK8_9BACI|nr:efflux RND transporter permease subunit [Bacillaceae bacterium 44XB]
MRKIINFSMNNKLAIWILTIMVIVAGLYSGLNMKQETMPDITMPNVSILTTYPGAAPDEVAEKVTEPLEQAIENLKDVKLVTSNSLANASSIQIEFDFNTDMDQAVNDVKEAVTDVEMPDQVKDPQVTRLSFNAFPVLALSLSDAKHSLKDLTQRVEKDVVPALSGIDGVADVQVTGQQLEKVNLDFDKKKLAQYGLTEKSVEQILQGSNITYPLGLTTFDKDVKNLVIDGNVATVADLKKIEIPAMPSQGAGQQAATGQAGAQQGVAQSQGGQAMPQAGAQSGPPASAQAQQGMKIPTVQLQDIAKVKLIGEAESISRTNGEESISIQIVKTSTANTVEVVNKVKDKIKDFEKDYGLTVETSFDQGEPIEDSVSTMLDKALFGILFAVVIILLFLRSIKTTLISIISIPLSLLIAIFIMHQMDITLNILTLGALTVAIGRVIDDSIVVMENIYRRMALPGEKLRGKALVREATRQMFTPIFSSTVVTIAVFLPLGFVSGQVGEMFMPFALAVVFALAASLVVAVTLVPMLAHTLFKKQLYADEALAVHHKEKPGKLANLYKRILKWTLNHKLITFGGSIVILVLSLFLLPLIGVSFLPEDEQKMVMATYSPEPGETKEEAEKSALQAEKLISKRDGVKSYQYSQGGGSPMGAMTGAGGGDNSALFFIEYDDDFENFKGEDLKLINKLNKETKNGEWKSMDFSGTGSSGLDLLVYGDDIEAIQKATDKIIPVLKKNKDLVKVDTSLSEAYDQYTLIANQKKLAENGLTAAQIGMELAKTAEQPSITKVKHEGKDVSVYLQTEEREYKSLKDLENVKITTPLGTQVKIKDVLDVKTGKSPDTIERRDGRMYASVTADVKSKDVGGVSRTVESKIDKLDLPDGTTVEFGGVTEDINKAFTQLALAMLAAVAIVYFVLVITFHGALAPFAILFSLPFIMIGSLIALWIGQEPLSVSSMIGLLMLIGIVVTNAIVLIDRVIHNERDGMTTREALLEAGSTRLRPILMTALATIGALIPLAVGLEGGGGGLISKGLGITVIGGLTSSTLLTLVIVPVVYEFLAKFRKKPLQETE